MKTASKYTTDSSFEASVTELKLCVNRKILFWAQQTEALLPWLRWAQNDLAVSAVDHHIASVRLSGNAAGIVRHLKLTILHVVQMPGVDRCKNLHTLCFKLLDFFPFGFV